MALVSISEAAKLAGVNRSTLYETYINQGLVSVVKDERGRPKIDTSELLRVFGALKGVKPTAEPDSTRQQNPTEPDSDLVHLLALAEQKNRLLQAQLEESKEREAFYQKQLTSMAESIKLLEYRPSRLWWQFWK